MKYGNINLQGLGELQNANIQNLPSAPTTNLSAGRIYFNTTDHKLYVYDGTNWLDASSQGDYTFMNGVENVSGTRNVQIKIATGDNAGNITLAAGTSGLKADAPIASNSQAGLIEIATDTEAATGTAENLAINPKQLATAIEGDIELTDLSIASGSTNYLEYDNTTGQFGAKVDTTVTADSTNLVTSGAVSEAIGLALTGALKYQGTWTATGQTDYSTIQLPVAKGFMYAVSGSATIGGVEWNAGDYLVINKDVAAGGTITSADVDKIDNTEASDIVRLSATQTLTNKTIDADDNTISDLELDNFKTGVVRTSTDGIRDASSAVDTAVVTEKNIATVLGKKVYSAQNTALTVSSGVCSWTVTHNLNNENVGVFLYEVSTGDRVMYDYSITSANVVTVKILAAANIAANTYKVVVLA